MQKFQKVSKSFKKFHQKLIELIETCSKFVLSFLGINGILGVKITKENMMWTMLLSLVAKEVQRFLSPKTEVKGPSKKVYLPTILMDAWAKKACSQLFKENL